jgi:hypothetical protein
MGWQDFVVRLLVEEFVSTEANRILHNFFDCVVNLLRHLEINQSTIHSEEPGLQIINF